jgi:hypothetical protein
MPKWGSSSFCSSSFAYSMRFARDTPTFRQGGRTTNGKRKAQWCQYGGAAGPNVRQCREHAACQPARGLTHE